jgi:Ulp1 family protease
MKNKNNKKCKVSPFTTTPTPTPTSTRPATPTATATQTATAASTRQATPTATATQTATAAAIAEAEEYFEKQRALRLQPIDPTQLAHLNTVYKMSGEEVVIDKFKIPMTVSNIECLRPGIWLNDEVINFYMRMLQVRWSGCVCMSV